MVISIRDYIATSLSVFGKFFGRVFCFGKLRREVESHCVLFYVNTKNSSTQFCCKGQHGFKVCRAQETVVSPLGLFKQSKRSKTRQNKQNTPSSPLFHLKCHQQKQKQNPLFIPFDWRRGRSRSRACSSSSSSSSGRNLFGMGNNIIPTIDLQDFPNGYEKLRRASEEWGCFRVLNHKIPLTLLAEMKRVVRSLLDLPMEIKKRNSDTIAGSGYMAPSKVNPLYEALGLYDPDSPQAVSSFCSQLNASPHQRETIEKYAEAVHGLAMYVARRLAESMGLRGDLFQDWVCQFRINKYNFTPATVGSYGVQIHTDSGFLTILQDDENVGGLEVMDRLGEFVAVDPAPGTLLVNLGDIAAIWSNGRLRTVQHRVLCKEATIRISIASFLLGPKEKAVEAPKELIDSEHPRLYRPVTFEEFRKLRLSTKLQAGEALALIPAQSNK